MIQLENAYKSITGKNFDFFVNAGLAKTECTTCQLFFDNCSGNVDLFEHQFIIDYLKDNPPKGDIEQFKIDVRDFFKTYGELIYNKETQYLKLSAQVYVDLFVNRYVAAGISEPKLPPECANGDFCLDLASGFNYIDFLENLNPSTSYFLIDKSYYTCECLKYKINKLGLKNIEIYCGCVKGFDTSIIKNHTVSAIRAKNILAYIPDFYDHIDKYKKIICENGHFVFQESIRSCAMNIHLSNKDRYFCNGWDSTLEIGSNQKDPLCLHTLVYKKVNNDNQQR